MKHPLHTCRMTPELVGLMASIAQRIGRLEGIKLHRPSPSVRRKNRIETIQSSLAIEGNSLTREQVTALIDNKHVIGPPKDVMEVRNAIAVYHELGTFDPYSEKSFLEAHRLLMDGLIESAGMYRQLPIGVIREGDIFHEAPKWQDVVPMMKVLFEYLNEHSDHWLLKSCRFHYQLEYIHPFEDGNGRMGRLWQTRLLMLYHPIFEFLPVEHLIKQNQRDYYRMLAASDESGDCTPFVIFMLDLIDACLQALSLDFRSVTLKPLDRIALALEHFSDAAFSRKAYQSFFKTISTATASRDLQLGVKKGLLIRSGDKRTAVYRNRND